MVGRLWWTPEPGQLLVQTSSITGHLVPRHLRDHEPVSIGCTSCDGNKGHPLWPDLSRFLRKPFDEYVRTGKAQTITLPPRRKR
jgi:hypothetical protein